MSVDRRTFLKLGGSAYFSLFAPPAWREARKLVRGGSLGRVVFCRAPRRLSHWLEYLCDGAVPVCEQTRCHEVVLCGTEATLVFDRKGYRRFA